MREGQGHDGPMSDKPEIETEELEDANGEPLPDREAMSVISPDGVFKPPTGDEFVPPPGEKEGI